MFELAATRASSPQIKQLADQIKSAQAPEIATMTSWLSARRADRTRGRARPGHARHDVRDGHGKLAGAKDGEFDRMFAQMMTAHHQGAIEMAQIEQTEGANAKAKELAATIAKTQQAEIGAMRKVAG